MSRKGKNTTHEALRRWRETPAVNPSHKTPALGVTERGGTIDVNSRRWRTAMAVATIAVVALMALGPQETPDLTTLWHQLESCQADEHNANDHMRRIAAFNRSRLLPPHQATFDSLSTVIDAIHRREMEAGADLFAELRKIGVVRQYPVGSDYPPCPQ